MRRLARLDPNVALAVGAGAIVALEAAYRTWVATPWLFAQAAVGAASLLLAWRERGRLRLWAVLAVAVGLQLALLATHLALDVLGDKDSHVVFRWQGNALRHGDYPRSEYPPGAVVLFAFEAWLGGGSTRTPNAIVMALSQAVLVAVVWLTRSAFAPWLTAVVALWPANAFYWQYKFDLVPAMLLALGLLLALRGRWPASGVVFAIGALVKWTPALAAIALAAWLVAHRRARDALACVGAFAATVALVYVPFLVWDGDVLAAYERQSGRAITPESLWYLLLRPLDLARVRTHISFSAGAPSWANAGAAILQAAFVLAVIALAARARTRRAAVALAALAPIVFLLSNRIFSPQFVLVLFAGWAVAAALVVRNAREQLVVGVAMCAAALGNAFVYPFALPRYDLTWPLCSLALFALGAAVTVWLASRASRTGDALG